MPTTYFWSNEASDLGGGADFSHKLLTTGAVTGTLVVSVAKAATETSYLFTEPAVPGTNGATGDHDLHVDVLTGHADMFLKVSWTRINSAGVAQTTSAATAEQNLSAGVKTFSGTALNLGAWASGDRLRVNLAFRNAAAMVARSVDISVDGVDSREVAPWSTATAYTLDSTPGSYALTGSSAALSLAAALSATPGSCALSGASANLAYGVELLATPGAYSVTGANAGMALGAVVTVTPGAYSLTGAAANVAAGYVLDVTPGAYLLTGGDADLAYVQAVAEGLQPIGLIPGKRYDPDSYMARLLGPPLEVRLRRELQESLEQAAKEQQPARTVQRKVKTAISRALSDEDRQAYLSAYTDAWLAFYGALLERARAEVAAQQEAQRLALEIELIRLQRLDDEEGEALAALMLML